MSKIRRIYDDSSQYYFITSKTNKGKKLFDNHKKVGLFLQCINYLQNKDYFDLYAWVILPNHFHLLLEIIGKKNISEIMHNFNSYTANQISKFLLSRGAEASTTGGVVSVDEASRLRRQGFHALPDNVSQSVEALATGRKYLKIWQTSFYDHIIRDQDDFYAHINYIHYNPVKHKYVDKPEDWPWPSYHTFLNKGYYEKGWGHDMIPNSIHRVKIE